MTSQKNTQLLVYPARTTRIFQKAKTKLPLARIRQRGWRWLLHVAWGCRQCDVLLYKCPFVFLTGNPSENNTKGISYKKNIFEMSQTTIEHWKRLWILWCRAYLCVWWETLGDISEKSVETTLSIVKKFNARMLSVKFSKYYYCHNATQI